MTKLIVLTLFFLLSWLTVFRAPTNWLWYVSILMTEFCWVFFILVFLLLWLPGGKYNTVSTIIGCASLVLYSVPVVSAYRLAPGVKSMFYGKISSSTDTVASPLQLLQMVSGIGAQQVSYQTFTYDEKKALTLDFYPSSKKSKRPCIIVVHGGSWAGGDSQQLPELNSILANNGYSVASINYRLAPHYKYPAPVEDITTALTYLRLHASDLAVDTTQFILLGRSAGGQIVLSAAYTLRDPSIKGIINFYGPSDMVWGYENPTSPLVLDSRKIMEDYLGGTYAQVPQQYSYSSATETASAAAVTTLSIYGENDPLVSHLHGVRLGKKLDRLHIQHYDVYLPWATHAFDYTLNGPGGQISTWCVLQFLKKITK